MTVEILQTGKNVVLKYYGESGARKSAEIVVSPPDDEDPYDKSTKLVFSLGNMQLSAPQKQKIAETFVGSQVKSLSEGDFRVRIDIGENCKPIDIFNKIQQLSHCDGIDNACAEEFAAAFTKTHMYQDAFVREATLLLESTQWLDPKDRHAKVTVPVDPKTGEFRVLRTKTPYLDALNATTDSKRRER